MKKYAEIVTNVKFPEPTGIVVNMMPFVMGDSDSVPVYLQQYVPLIEACGLEESQYGKVGYLTVTETVTTPGVSQRRGGVHVEKHPSDAPYLKGADRSWGGGGWGRGVFNDRREDGLYIVSNMSDTTAVWDEYVDEPHMGGDVEHLTHTFRNPQVNLKANELAWITDSTPHASLPVQEAGTRQFFRLVTNKVGLWFTQHSTPNPLGVTPPDNVHLVTANKFDM